jgi:hypothetical protein
METTPLAELGSQMTEYLPTLLAGLLVLVIGIAVGWLAKRLLISVLNWLRLDRFGARAGWRAALGKGDLRAAVYNGLGDVAFFLVFLVFLNNALEIWRLTVLSRIIDRVVVYLPNLALVVFIVIVGFMLANAVGQRTEVGLREEGFPRARLLGRIVKSMVLAVVAALALWQLNLAREIVLAAFLTGFGAMGIAFALAVGIGSAKAIQRGWEALFEGNNEEDDAP